MLPSRVNEMIRKALRGTWVRENGLTGTCDTARRNYAQARISEAVGGVCPDYAHSEHDPDSDAAKDRSQNTADVGPCSRKPACGPAGLARGPDRDKPASAPSIIGIAEFADSR
jgi:hypothetical protein